jgi:hypothetical protein
MKYDLYQWGGHWRSGQRFGLEHLDPYSFVHSVAARDRGPGRPTEPALDIVVNVAFSHHCFTNGPKHPDFNPSDMFAYDDDRRSFCPARFSLSHDLPSHIRGLGKKRCFRTTYNNYFAVATQLGKGAGYYTVIFQVEPASRDEPYAVNLLVESAHIKSSLPILGKGAFQEAFTAILVGRLAK